MHVFSKSVVTFNVLVSTLLTFAAQGSFASNMIVINQKIESTETVLPNRPDTGYQYFFRFAELGNGPECNLHIVSKNGPIEIEAGTILQSTKGIEVNPNPGQHPLDFSSSRSVRIDADVVEGNGFTIRCSDSKGLFSFRSLKEFNKEEINEFTLPYIEIK